MLFCLKHLISMHCTLTNYLLVHTYVHAYVYTYVAVYHALYVWTLHVHAYMSKSELTHTININLQFSTSLSSLTIQCEPHNIFTKTMT